MCATRLKRFPEFNTEWFEDQMRRHDLTYEELAKIMGVEFASARSTAFKVVQGEQKLRGEWAARIADAFRVPLEDVLREAGMLGGDMVLSNRKKKTTVHLQGELLNGQVTRLKGNAARRTAPLPPGMPDHTQAISIGTEGLFRGWTAYFLPAEASASQLAGKVCIASTGEQVLIGKLERGSRAGYYSVQPLTGRKIDDVRLEWSSAVLWMSAA